MIINDKAPFFFKVYMTSKMLLWKLISKNENIKNKFKQAFVKKRVAKENVDDSEEAQNHT